MKDRLLKFSSAVMLGAMLQGGAFDSPQYSSEASQSKSEEQENKIIDVTEFTQYGQFPGVGGLGHTDEGVQIYDSDTFI